jgi:biotin carboxyl carrier protein
MVYFYWHGLCGWLPLFEHADSSHKKRRPASDDDLFSHLMYPQVTEVAVSPGQEVKAGDKLVVLEAMKMLTTVSASADGVIEAVLVHKGEQVDSDDLLVKIG